MALRFGVPGRDLHGREKPVYREWSGNGDPSPAGCPPCPDPDGGGKSQNDRIGGGWIGKWEEGKEAFIKFVEMVGEK